MKKIFNLIFIVSGLIFSMEMKAQVTTSTIRGVVNDDSGSGMPGATVVAVHTPSGTEYGTVALTNGGYVLPNLRVGGPYTVTISSVGFQTQEITDIFLSLGRELTINIDMVTDVQQLEEVVVSVDPTFNSDRTGSSQEFDNSTIQKMPTITRSAQDIYRLSPLSDGNSFGGRSNQYNNFSLDGSIFNNPFGLDAATPGGQTDAQPISLDAIDQIQVSFSPYDVTQAGFTGASVNAVTKSGTNKWTGTVFGFTRSDAFTGSKVDGEDIFVPDLSQTQVGASVGGPLIKNKLFIFANFEMERRNDLGSSFIANNGDGTTGINEARVLESDLTTVQSLLRGVGYDPGRYQGFTHDTDNQKWIVKFDLNLGQKHTLSAVYNGLDALKQKPAHPSAIGRRGPDATTVQFENSGYQINNKIHSGLLELRSRFSNKISNKFQIGMTSFRDTRDPFSGPAPVININQNGVRAIVAGHEPFSINNRLDQDVFQVSNNLDIYSGDHTFTVGASLERFAFDNSFNLGVYEPFELFGPLAPNTDAYLGGTFGPGYGSVSDFAAFVNSGQFANILNFSQTTFDTNEANDSWALAETNVGQFAFYLQDRWSVNDRFTLTTGLRIDVPMYFDTDEKIRENIIRKGGDPTTLLGGSYDPSITYFDEDGNAIQFDHTVLPSGGTLFSPRVGFNYDVNGDKSFQIRGGTGLFSGRFPFVWVGNQVANPDNFFYTMTRDDFKFPQVWRTSLGMDKKLNNGWLATVDLAYTKDINAMMVRNYGIGLPGGTNGTLTGGPDDRQIYDSSQRALNFGAPTNAYVFTNSDKGHSFTGTLQMKKNWSNGWYTSLGYNYLRSMDVSSIRAEISSDAYDRNPAFGHVNADVVNPSVYGNRHRIVGNANKSWSYAGDKMATTVSLFFEYAEGGRYSYTYSGDINNDGSFLNDLIYIPTDTQIDGMNFAAPVFATDPTVAEQRAALKAYIAQDDYLSERRGKYAERNATLSPWYSRWDIRFLQDYNLTGGNTIQFSIDILNAGNLVSSKWGVREIPTNTQPIGVSVAGTVPTYSFDPGLTDTFTANSALISRWQVQFGLRYIFR